MARLSLVLFVCCLFIGVYVNSHVLKSEASPNQAVVSMQDDEPMVISEISDDGIIPLEVQSLDGINEEKKCAVIGEFVSI